MQVIKVFIRSSAFGAWKVFTPLQFLCIWLDFHLHTITHNDTEFENVIKNKNSEVSIESSTFLRAEFVSVICYLQIFGGLRHDRCCLPHILLVVLPKEFRMSHHRFSAFWLQSRVLIRLLSDISFIAGLMVAEWLACLPYSMEILGSIPWSRQRPFCVLGQKSRNFIATSTHPLLFEQSSLKTQSFWCLESFHTPSVFDRAPSCCCNVIPLFLLCSANKASSDQTLNCLK